MARTARTGNVRKICRCSNWKRCVHPWYVWFVLQGHDLRVNLDLRSGRHARSFEQAKKLASALIVEWIDSLTRPYLLAREKHAKVASR